MLFPVISISLKSVDGRNFETASAALRTVIGDEAMRFQFLLESEHGCSPNPKVLSVIRRVVERTV